MNDLTHLGTAAGYLARPAGDGPWPGLIVIQEWWGLDEQTKSIARRFAELGYLAFAPDLYQGEAARLGENEKAMALVHKYGPEAPNMLSKIFDTLKTHPDCTGKIGSVGFCFGGRMALALSVHRPVAAVCTFYGGGMQVMFGPLRQHLRAPVLGLFGDQDVSIPAGTVAEFDKLLDQVGVEHEVIVYPHSGHAFFRDSDPKVYKPVAAQDAWARVTRFFEKHLK